MKQTADILVIGGGIIGLTTAIRFREARAEVILVDQGELGREASWAGAGILPPGNPEKTTTPIDRLRAIGSVEFPNFSSELCETTGIDNGYRRNGGIEFLTPDDAYAVELWQTEGIAFEPISDRRVPDSTAYFLPGMAQVRNPRHLRALILRAGQLEVQLRPHTVVMEWIIDRGQVNGVRLANNEVISAKYYVVAAGPWSEKLLNPLNCHPGIHPVRGQIVLLRSNPEVLGPTLIVGKRYLVPRGDGRVLVGSTEEPEAGFEKQTTSDGVNALREFAYEMVPELREASLEASWAGLRPGSPDGQPMIGVVPGYSKIFAAIGHSRAGVQLSLGTARLLVEMIMNRPRCVPESSFALDRRPDARPRPTFRS